MKFDINNLLTENSYEIMNFYLKTFNNNQTLKQGKNISNPFLTEKQKTPSFNIYFCKKHNTWLYKDFATANHGDCIELVKQLFNLPYKEAVERIYDEVLDYIPNQFENSTQQIKSAENKRDTLKKPTLAIKQFSEMELAYWKQFGITHEILSLFGVFSLKQIFSYKANETEADFLMISPLNMVTQLKRDCGPMSEYSMK
jgi:DNA primase